MLGLRDFFEAVFAPALDIHVESKTETVGAAMRHFGGAPRPPWSATATST